MNKLLRTLFAVLAANFAAPFANAGSIDPAAVQFQTPAQIKWVRNAAGTNESAIPPSPAPT